MHKLTHDDYETLRHHWQLLGDLTLLEEFDMDRLRADLAELTEESNMDTMTVINEIMTNNQADLQPIITQCGGALPFMSLLPHLEAVVKTSQAAADPATAVDDVVKHNEQSIRVIFQMLGGLDGLLKLEPNFTNIYRTVQKTGHPLHTLVKEAATLEQVPGMLKAKP